MAKHYMEEPVAKRPAAPKSHHRLRKLVGTAMAICAAGAVSIGCVATVLADDVPVTSSVIDGTTIYSVSINSTDADTLLQEAGIVLNNNDLVVREENADGITVTVRRQIAAEIQVGGETITVDGYTGDTVGQLLEKAGVELDALDAVSPDVSTQLMADTTVTVTKMKKVYIVDKNVARNYIVPVGTVAEAVEFAGIQLGEEDTVSNAKKQVKDNMVIRVNRVTYAEYQKTKVIDYEVKEQETDSLNLGETKVKSEGQEGEKVITYRQKLVNGEVVETKKVSTEVVKEAEDRVILIGTKVEEMETTTTDSSSNSFTDNGGGTLIDANGQEVSYQRVLSGSCTAYTGDKNKTATGTKAEVGVVAVNPNIIPYGSRLYIASADGSYVYGYAVAGDTGGAMMKGDALVDLYMNTKKECINFGRRTLNVYVLS